jgi:pyruvate/2-oxoglutarate dehydrogenase complex dihydrolipoamide dehydrogenase (E3) component
MTVDAILFSSGRTPNVENLGLEAAGVDFDSTDGIFVNKYLQTTN